MRTVYSSLLDAPKDYAIVHCISADCAMGITSDGREIPCLALTLRKEYPMMPDYCKKFDPTVGQSITFTGSDHRVIFNLVTKDRYYDKPTYTTLFNALYDLRTIAIRTGYFKLAIPKLGSGLDQLNWTRVSKIIEYVFEGTGIEIVLYNPQQLAGTRPHTKIIDEVYDPNGR